MSNAAKPGNSLLIVTWFKLVCHVELLSEPSTIQTGCSVQARAITTRLLSPETLTVIGPDQNSHYRYFTLRCKLSLLRDS